MSLLLLYKVQKLEENIKTMLCWLRMEDTCLETAWLCSWGHEQGEAQSAQDNKGIASFSSPKFIVSLITNDVC